MLRVSISIIFYPAYLDVHHVYSCLLWNSTSSYGACFSICHFLISRLSVRHFNAACLCVYYFQCCHFNAVFLSVCHFQCRLLMRLHSNAACFMCLPFSIPHVYVSFQCRVFMYLPFSMPHVYVSSIFNAACFMCLPFSMPLVVFRYLTFTNQAEFEAALKKKCPIKIDIGTRIISKNWKYIIFVSKFIGN